MVMIMRDFVFECSHQDRIYVRGSCHPSELNPLRKIRHRLHKNEIVYEIREQIIF